jgi:hypothetical protein
MVRKSAYFLFEKTVFEFFSMYEKMISHLNIDEIGTNFPQVNFIENFIFIYFV